MRGQPLFVFGALSLGWIGMRAMLWQAPFPLQPYVPLAQPMIIAGMKGGSETAGQTSGPQLALEEPSGRGMQDWHLATAEWTTPHEAWSNARPPGERGLAALRDGDDFSISFAPVPPRLAASHALLAAAGFASLPLPQNPVPYVVAQRAENSLAGLPQGGAALAGGAPFPVPFAAGESRPDRWSADGWLLWRDDATTPILTGRSPFGRSQAGAVARYELAPSSGHRPQAYLRGSTTLEGRRDLEGAVGLSARPLPRVPLRLAAEIRLADRPGGRETRPAAYAVTELPPVSLPGNFEGEVYLQGGYVGGDFATAFVDGQVRIDRPLAGLGDVELRAGGGAWGGAQADAERLDIGPSASLRFRLGEAHGRLAADYRFRVAGDAQPASGPALTLSAGF